MALCDDQTVKLAQTELTQQPLNIDMKFGADVYDSQGWEKKFLNNTISIGW